MSPDQALAVVESLLARTGRSVSGKNHYRMISLGNGKKLSVDVFRGASTEGHIRVMVFNVSEAEARCVHIGQAPEVPSPRDFNCSVCRKIPNARHYPAHWYGPGSGEREYFGYEWHTGAEPIELDLDTIGRLVHWLHQQS